MRAVLSGARQRWMIESEANVSKRAAAPWSVCVRKEGKREEINWAGEGAVERASARARVRGGMPCVRLRAGAWV
eukprot:6205394-Pleurochrysis_carterae.AAC.2